MGRGPRVDRPPEEKRQIVQEGIKSGNVSETCRRHGISPSLFPHVRRAPRPDKLSGAAKVSRSKVPTLCWRKGWGTRPRAYYWRTAAAPSPAHVPAAVPIAPPPVLKAITPLWSAQKAR
jgi:hypothetical protein